MLEVRQLLISESIPKVQLTILMFWWLNRCFCKLEHICQIIELICCYMWFKMTAHKWLYWDKYQIDGRGVQLCSSPLKTFDNALFIVTLKLAAVTWNAWLFFHIFKTCLGFSACCQLLSNACRLLSGIFNKTVELKIFLSLSEDYQ